MKKKMPLLLGLFTMLILSSNQVLAHPNNGHSNFKNKTPIESHQHYKRHGHCKTMPHKRVMYSRPIPQRSLLGAHVHVGPISIGFSI